MIEVGHAGRSNSEEAAAPSNQISHQGTKARDGVIDKLLLATLSLRPGSSYGAKEGGEEWPDGGRAFLCSLTMPPAVSTKCHELNEEQNDKRIVIRHWLAHRAGLTWNS